MSAFDSELESMEIAADAGQQAAEGSSPSLSSEEFDAPAREDEVRIVHTQIPITALDLISPEGGIVLAMRRINSSINHASALRACFLQCCACCTLAMLSRCATCSLRAARARVVRKCLRCMPRMRACGPWSGVQSVKWSAGS